MDDEAQTRGRGRIIQAVRSPLGFLTLMALITEAIIAGLAVRAEGINFTLLVGGTLFVVIVLVVTGAAMALREARPSPPSDSVGEDDTAPELRDPAFWAAACDAIAVPVFVKRREGGGVHLFQNEALVAFEKAHIGRYARSDAIEDTISRDHQAGDEEAYSNGSSNRIEIRAHGEPGVQKIAILTQKRKITYNGTDYLVGTYRPLLEPPQRLTGKFRVKYLEGQIPLALPREEHQGKHAAVEIGLGDAMNLCFGDDSAK